METQPPLLISAASAAQIMGISKRMLHYLRKREDFPKPIVLGPRAVRWRRQEIEAWVAGLAVESRQRIEPPQLARSRFDWPPRCPA